MSERFDLVVVGGGPGGSAAAIRAAELGARVALIEKGQMGGTCLNIGCIPTKALIGSAEVYRTARRGADFGLDIPRVGLDLARVLERKQAIVKKLRADVEDSLSFSGVQVMRGTATLLRPNRIQVEDGAEAHEIEAGRVILATGSEAGRPPVAGIDLPGVITSTEALSPERLPSSMIVVGGGAIGIEFACLYSALGTEVTVIEMLPSILPMVDGEIARYLRSLLRRDGVRVHTGARVQKIGVADGEEKQVVFESTTGVREATADLVLLATGRRPYTAGLNLDDLGVKTERGAVVVNEHMETSVEGIYAVGDVTGGSMLAHVASAEGWVAAENALGHRTSVDYRSVPNCIFCQPEIASVGLTEAQAREAGLAVRVGKANFMANGRALALGEASGLVKLVCEAGSGRVLGVHIIGPHATDLIGEAALAIQTEATVGDLTRTFHAHPTLPEALLEAAQKAAGPSGPGC